MAEFSDVKSQILNFKKVLDIKDDRLQFLNPIRTGIGVLLPRESNSDNLEFIITNTSYVNDLTIKDNFGNIIFHKLIPGEISRFSYINSAWKKFVGGSVWPGTIGRTGDIGLTNA